MRAATLERLVDLILAVERPHPVRVGIDGVSAAGKTKLADELARLIDRRGRTALRVSVDDFHNPGSVRHARGDLSQEGYYLDSFNYTAFIKEVLMPLGPDGNRRFRAATWDAFHNYPEGLPLDSPLREAGPNTILLCDCIFAFRPELNDSWDFRIFIEVDFDEAFRRSLTRNLAWTSEDQIRLRYEQCYIPAERRYLETVRPGEIADVVVDNRDPAHPVLTVKADEPVSRQGEPFSLRPIQAGDREFLEDMLHEAAGAAYLPDYETESPRDRLTSTDLHRKYLGEWGRPSDNGVIAVTPEGSPIGAAWYRVFAASDAGDGIDASIPRIAVAVSADQRGRGLGPALLEALFTQARADGFSQLSLGGVHRSNARAIAVYQKMGFRVHAETEHTLKLIKDLREG